MTKEELIEAIREDADYMKEAIQNILDDLDNNELLAGDVELFLTRIEGMAHSLNYEIESYRIKYLN